MTSFVTPHKNDLGRATKRAPRLTPEDRRSAIVGALAPYVLTHGSDLSTRDLAAAAGVAEGTLFRVFPDKKALMTAVIVEAAQQHFGVDRAVPSFPAVDSQSSLEARLLAVVEYVDERAEESFRVMTMLHQLEPADLPSGIALPHPRAHTRSYSPEALQRRAELEAQLTEILGEDAKRVRMPIGPLIDAIRSLAVGRYMAPQTATPPLSPQQIVGLLMRGAFASPSAELSG